TGFAMSFDGSSPDDTSSSPNAPLLVTKRADFQWTIALSDSLPSGWQDHLTDYLVAEATVSLALQDEEPLSVTEAKLLDDPRGLYQITSYERSVEVRAAYRALRQSFMETPYDCQLLIKTPAGGRFVTIPAPQPPSQEEWKQLVKKIWFRVVLAGGDLGVASAAGSSSVKEQPLYTFKLHDELAWDDPAADTALNEWQRELRLIVDPQQSDVVYAQLAWSGRQPTGNQMMVTGPMPRIGAVSRGRYKPGRRGRRKQNHRTGAFAPIQRRPFWSRVALLTTALLLLLLVAVVAVGAIKSRAGASAPLALSHPSPTLAPTSFPSATATDVPTVGSTPVPTSSPAPAPTEQRAPTPTATHRPQPTATATPYPSATSTSTPTPTPSPTATPTPSPTSTPIPIVNVVISPTSFSDTCPTLSALTVTIDNTGSNVDVNWQVSITDTDPMGNVWATASQTGGTVLAGQSASITITPTSTLCQDMTTGQTLPYTAAFSYSGGTQSGQATITDTVSA
ncbi:MAG TPA: hypothetical protein VF099_05765, partial [Ktedonobacterales bacterium]